MNNKGFTLVEMLAVVVILGIVMGIATNGVLNYIETSKKKSEKIFVDKIENAIKSYISLNRNTFSKKNDSSEITFDKCKKYDESGNCPSDNVVETKVYEMESFDLVKITEEILQKEQIVNPKNKKKCFSSLNENNLNVRLFEDDDKVIYYYIDLSNFSCDVSSENKIITNIPKKLCTYFKQDDLKGVNEYFNTYKYFCDGNYSSCDRLYTVNSGSVTMSSSDYWLTYSVSTVASKFYKEQSSVSGYRVQYGTNISYFARGFKFNKSTGYYILSSPRTINLKDSTNKSKVISTFKYTCGYDASTGQPISQCQRLYKVNTINGSYPSYTIEGLVYSSREGYFDGDKYGPNLGRTFSLNSIRNFCSVFIRNTSNGKYQLNNCRNFYYGEHVSQNAIFRCVG